MLPIVAAVCIVGTFALLVAQEIFTLPEGWSRLIPVALAFVFGLFSFRGCVGVKNELIENGVLTEGKALDRLTETTTRRGSTSTFKYVNYSFKDMEGHYCTGRHSDATNGSFENVPLPVLYSSQYPTVSIVLNTEKDVKEYLKIDSIISVVNLDFDRIANTKSIDSITSYLKEVSPLWAKVQDPESAMWLYRPDGALLEVDLSTNSYLLELKTENAMSQLKNNLVKANFTPSTVELEENKPIDWWSNANTGKSVITYTRIQQEKSNSSYNDIGYFKRVHMLIFTGLRDDYDIKVDNVQFSEE